MGFECFSLKVLVKNAHFYFFMGIYKCRAILMGQNDLFVLVNKVIHYEKGNRVREQHGQGS